jgi:5-oxoprolinase (ATP-hydrolysing) subunit A
MLTIEGGRMSIDLNCDMGEGIGNDEAIMPYISSANIACGYHAGDESTMRRTVELAIQYRVAIGAHPSYPDREHFGRVDILGDPGVRIADLAQILTDQLIVLQKICGEYGVGLHHVKPHGALYNRAAKDPAVSAILCETIRQFDPTLLLYGSSGSVMQTEAERCGLRFVHEVFADRGYREDGSLVPRNETHALIEEPAAAVRQVLTMIRDGRVATGNGVTISLAAGTVCIHGDGAHALVLVRAIHEALKEGAIDIRAPF